MIDFHSHILPGIDDGSRDVNESIAMLKMLSEQGVDTVVATPHFYADQRTVEDFLKRRDNAYEALKTHLSSDSLRMNILKGAEVLYYSGIGKLPDLGKLCIEGTNILLLEMPMMKWTEYIVKELIELAGRGKLTIVLAHVERYMKMQSDDTIYRLYQSGILVQVNASHFIGFGTKRGAVSMLRAGGIHFIGSDCHNTTSRPPRIGKAFDIIRKKLGEDFLAQFNEYGESLLHIK